MVIKLSFININHVIKKIIIVFLLIFNSIVHSAGVVVSKIYFDGLNRVSLDTVLSKLPVKVGDLVNDDVIADSIKIFFATEYFENIKMSYDKLGVLTIQVKEYPIINDVSYCGNKKIKDDIIQKILDLKNIQSGQPLNDCSLYEAEHSLKEILHSLGKLNATVEIVITSLSRNRIDLKIIITEGKTAKIKQICIIGNHVFHKKKLLSKLKFYNKLSWWSFLHTKEYETQKFLDDLEKLRNFYMNHGYLKFSIDSTQVDFTSDKMNLYVCLYITEGSRYSFSSITFHGEIFNSLPNIKNCINIFPGELYSSDKIKELEHNIQYVLGMYGYIKPLISIESDVNENNKTVKLYIYVDPGNRYYVHEIRFEGNSITKDSVIRRAIHQMENTQLNYVNIFKDQERLMRFGYFKHVDARIKYLPNILDQIDIIYRIEEQNTGNLNLSVGVGTESGINLQFGVRQENFLGTGNSIAITSTKNQYQTYAEISVVQSYCNIDNMSIEGKLFYNNMDTNYTNSSDYNLKNYGMNYNCMYSFFEYHKFNIGLNYISNYVSKIVPQVAIWRYLYSMHMYPDVFCSKYFIKKNISFHANDFILISGWTLNSLNHAYFPTSGSYFSILNKLTLPGSKNQYYKFTVDGSYYLSLDQHSDWVFMTSVCIGYAGKIHNKESPFYDNFYAGGINTIRGFRLNSIGPKAAYYHCNETSNIADCAMCVVEDSQDAIGGNAVSFIKTELIIPVIYFDQKYADVTRISVFLDAGTVWDTFWKNTEITRAAGIIDYSMPNKIRISSGISLKWISPIGPIIFSYSKPIKKYLGDTEEPFQFSVGKTW